MLCFQTVNRFRIDSINIYEILGREKLVALSTCFYDKVYADREPAFRGQFPRDKDMAIQNQYEFLIQRFGGPPEYSERKGHPALRARHVNFSITRANAEKWLAYMREAMIEMAIPEPAQTYMDEFFEDTAYFMQNIDENGERIYG